MHLLSAASLCTAKNRVRLRLSFLLIFFVPLIFIPALSSSSQSSSSKSSSSKSSSSKLSSIRAAQPVYHPENPAAHIVPLKAYTIGDPLAFLQTINTQSQESGIKFVVHRIGDFFNHKEGALSSVREANPSNVTRVTIGMLEMKHSHYVGPVYIGSPGQRKNLVFDTGSANMQVVGSWCIDVTCLKVSRFDPSQSSTFRLIQPPVKVDISFGTGKIHAQMATDVVAIGPYKVEQQTMGVIDHETATSGKPNVFDRIDFEGILGFGFPSLASAGRVPFLDNLMTGSETKANEFAIYMGHPRDPNAKPGSAESISSAFFIGGVDPRFYDGPIGMVPVVREHYWEVGLDSFWIGDKKFCCEEGSKNYVIFDSGTSFNTLPHKEIGRFSDLVPKRPCEDNVEDVINSFPTLKYKLTGGIDIVITPHMYVIPTLQHVCMPAYMEIDVASEFGHAYLLGSIPYMRHYYTVFRRGIHEPSMVGIARAKHSEEAISFLQSLEEKS